jgi:hypothetical protein
VKSFWVAIKDLLGLASDKPEEETTLAREIARQRVVLTELAAQRAGHEQRIADLRIRLTAPLPEPERAELDDALKEALHKLATIKRRQSGLKRLRDTAVDNDTQTNAIDRPDPIPPHPTRLALRALDTQLTDANAQLHTRFERAARYANCAAHAGAA